MASIFTYEPNPPRVSSPWLRPSASTPAVSDASVAEGRESPKVSVLADCGITKLEAEPQDGPTEYKLHLLLRPRRSFSVMSTGTKVSGSTQPGSKAVTPEVPGPAKSQPSLAPAPSLITRQNRLQHLTTQLLWRLQQSSPYHSSSAANLVIPSLPGTVPQSGSLPPTSNLLPGLEESEGALYEIGVSDDGTFVGLTRDEMDESLLNLRSMAASLGCEVRVLRNVIVGDCEWTENSVDPSKFHTEKLYVAEALVVPSVRRSYNRKPLLDTNNGTKHLSNRGEDQDQDHGSETSRTEQMRVSLTGSTTSGKSTLLGTLSTSTLDNGRGKSRLSLLKHRHEIVSGITSSVAPEILGYPARVDHQNVSHVVNYDRGNVSSWTDIHNEAGGGRLVFVVDSAGHPRYRRTTVRGLLSWAPHWTFCCIAADDDEDASGKIGATMKSDEILGSPGIDVDLSKAHLELCLKLSLPLVVVITKFDIASKSGLRQTLAKVLSTVKAYGRRPLMLSPGRSSRAFQAEQELGSIPDAMDEEVERVLRPSTGDSVLDSVPIVFTSAVTGDGIGMVHALLRRLPIPRLRLPSHCGAEVNNQPNTQPRTLFHVDEVFQRVNDSPDPNFVLGGFLGYGQLSLGDELLLGPFALDVSDDDVGQPEMIRSSSYPGQSLGEMISAHRGSPPLPSITNPGKGPSLTSPLPGETWRAVRVVSLRNLRLAVRRLEHDQVGTVGVEFVDAVTSAKTPFNPRLRRGMVLLSIKEPHHPPPPAYAGFTALFNHAQVSSLSINSTVIAYVASIRAPAKIVRAGITTAGLLEERRGADEDDAMWGSDENGSDEGGVELPVRSPAASQRKIAVTLRFATYREWIEIGTKVLIMPGGGERGEKGNLGLDGFVGRIIEGVV